MKDEISSREECSDFVYLIGKMEEYEELDELTKKMKKIFRKKLLNIPVGKDGIRRVTEVDGASKAKAACVYHPNGLVESPLMDTGYKTLGRIVLDPYESEVILTEKKKPVYLDWLSGINKFTNYVVREYTGTPLPVQPLFKVPIAKTVELIDKMEASGDLTKVEKKAIVKSLDSKISRTKVEVALTNMAAYLILQRDYVYNSDSSWDGTKYVAEVQKISKDTVFQKDRYGARGFTLYAPGARGREDFLYPGKIAEINRFDGDGKAVHHSKFKVGVPLSKGGFDRHYTPDRLSGTSSSTCSYVLRWPDKEQSEYLYFMGEKSGKVPYYNRSAVEREAREVLIKLKHEVEIPCSEDYDSDKDWYRVIIDTLEPVADDTIRKLFVRMGLLPKKKVVHEVQG